MALTEAKEFLAFILSGPAMLTGSPVFLWNEKQQDFVAKRIQVVSQHYEITEVVNGKKAAIPMLIGSVVLVLAQQLLVLQLMKQMKPQPATEAATPTDAGINAGMAANGSVDLSGDHLKGIHVP